MHPERRRPRDDHAVLGDRVDFGVDAVQGGHAGAVGEMPVEERSGHARGPAGGRRVRAVGEVPLHAEVGRQPDGHVPSTFEVEASVGGLAVAEVELRGLEEAVDAALGEGGGTDARRRLLSEVIEMAVARRRAVGTLLSDPVLVRCHHFVIDVDDDTLRRELFEVLVPLPPLPPDRQGPADTRVTDIAGSQRGEWQG
jgi:hypothetical protein